jgi:hypothetical protein
MTRAELLNRLCGLFDQPRYLEIGVHNGETFMAIAAARKVGVDPKFLFDIDAAMRAQPHASLHAMPSDAFFGGPHMVADGYDVIFLDGLHTAEQTLRDLLNATDLLRPGGVIVLDDMLPSSYHAALPDGLAAIRLREHLRDPDTSWMGDVYKLAFFIDSFMQQFSVATVGMQLLMWRAPRAPADIGQRSLEQVARMAFEETVFQRAVFNPCSLDQAIALMQR